jgi:hypothetical protein
MPKYYPGLRDILPDMGNILAYYLDKTPLQSVNIAIDPECMAHREDIINKKYYHV